MYGLLCVTIQLLGQAKFWVLQYGSWFCHLKHVSYFYNIETHFRDWDICICIIFFGVLKIKNIKGHSFKFLICQSFRYLEIYDKSIIRLLRTQFLFTLFFLIIYWFIINFYIHPHYWYYLIFLSWITCYFNWSKKNSV